MTEPLLRVAALKKCFPVYSGWLGKVTGQVKAVDDVSFNLNSGETLGLAGESGCGKTTVGRMTLRLVEPTDGKIAFGGIDILQLRRQEMRAFRPRMQMIFQDPYSSLNPRFTVEQLIGEAMLAHGRATPLDLEEKVAAALGQVGLPAQFARRFPHEFSGGQRQRIGIARALALNPEYLVCDEPVSALDVSIQAQIINLLQQLRRERRLAMLFISHDLNVIQHISDRVAVMYLGRLVEIAPVSVLNQEAAHPYTQALLAANPVPIPGRRRQGSILGGDIPSPLQPPGGCHFHPRCPRVMSHCRTVTPVTTPLGTGHSVACHLYG